MKTKKYEPPRTNILPLNGRVYCTKIMRLEKVRESGIIQPVTFQVPDEQGNPVTVAYNRYIVVAVAEDVNITVLDGSAGGRKLKWGDEIFPMENPDATGWTLPIITDFENDRREFFVLHESEIIGWVEPSDIIVEDE
jgi:hypothetical protein